MQAQVAFCPGTDPGKVDTLDGSFRSRPSLTEVVNCSQCDQRRPIGHAVQAASCRCAAAEVCQVGPTFSLRYARSFW